MGTHASYRIRLIVLSPISISCIRNHYIHTLCAPSDGSLGAWNIEYGILYLIHFQQKFLGSISFSITLRWKKIRAFFILVCRVWIFSLYYKNIHSVWPSVWFSSKKKKKYFRTKLCALGEKKGVGGDMVPLSFKSPFNLYNVMRSRCDFGFTFQLYAS